MRQIVCGKMPPGEAVGAFAEWVRDRWDDEEAKGVGKVAAPFAEKKGSPDAIELDGVTQDQRRNILELIERRFGAEMTGKVTSISYHAKNKRFNVHIEQRISKRERELLEPRYLVVDPGITSVGWGPRD